MGIKSLSKFIKDKGNTGIVEIPMSRFRGKRVAIDASNWMHRAWATASRRVVEATNVALDEPDHDRIVVEWLRQLQIFVRKFLMAGITPIFVVDGKLPAEKSDTQEKRREDKAKVRERLTTLKEELNGHDDLELSSGPLAGRLKELKSLQKRDTPFSKQDRELLASVLQAVGLPYLQAAGEAEQLCSMMCVQGLVSAVFSTDTDNLVYGCPILLTDFTGTTGRSEDHFETYLLTNILQQSGLTMAMFVDMCIMSGCDYNTNMPRVAIGNAYKLITAHGSIDKLPSQYDSTCLKTDFCRRQFMPVPAQSLYAPPVDALSDASGDGATSNSTATVLTECINVVNRLHSARDVLEELKMERWLEELSQLYSRLPPPQNEQKPPTKVRRPTVMARLSVIPSSGSTSSTSFTSVTATDAVSLTSAHDSVSLTKKQLQDRDDSFIQAQMQAFLSGNLS